MKRFKRFPVPARGVRGLLAPAAGLLVLAFAQTAAAQVNSWTKPESGFWHENHWSAGALPGAGQTILITNAGSKTVIVSPETAKLYSGTLTNGSITISAPEDSLNTLLLQNAWFSAPFRVDGTLSVSSNASLVVLGSLLEADSLHLAGSANQGDFSFVRLGYLRQRDNGVYNLTNGTLRVAYHYVGEDSSSGVFNHYGGTNLCLAALTITRGEYNLFGGRLEIPVGNYRYILVGNMRARSGIFSQSGGTVDGEMLVGWGGSGHYSLSGGLRTGGPLRISGISHLAWGSVSQSGGTNIGAIQITPYVDVFEGIGSGGYDFSAGEIWSTTVTVGPSGSFTQSDGVHMNESITLSGTRYHRRVQPGYQFPDPLPMYPGSYSLNSGTLDSSTIHMGFGTFFTQRGGQLTVEHVRMINGGWQSWVDNAAFWQSGGVSKVENLSMRFSFFRQSGGELYIGNISLQDQAVFKQEGGTLDHSGWIAITNSTWILQSGKQLLGPLRLAGSAQGRSWLVFPTNTCALRFADSSSMEWSQARLIVQGWNGSFAGGGGHQLRFESGAAGLLPVQLAQIFFENPAGHEGLYPARMLSDGEIVPVPILHFAKHSSHFTLHWPDGLVLQTSPTVHGPYEDVIDAVSPYELDFVEPRRFFRLRE